MLTPIDIQNHSLKSTMGGYNKKETDDFIESIQASYEQLYKENHDLKEKITALSEGLQYYKKMEGTLQKTLVLAEKTATETLEASRTKASKVEKESQEKANVMLSSAKARADAIVGEAEKRASAMAAESQAKADSLISDAASKAESTVSEAQAKTNSLIANAKGRAERILADARKSAEDLMDRTRESTEKMLRDADSQLGDISSAAHRLADSYHDYKGQFRAMLEKQLAQLENQDLSVRVPDLENVLQSQQVTLSEQQISLRSEIGAIETKIQELDSPLEDTFMPTKEPAGFDGKMPGLGGAEATAMEERTGAVGQIDFSVLSDLEEPVHEKGGAAGSQGEISHGSFSQGDFSQDNYSQGSFSQGDFPQDNYSQGSFSQGDFPQDNVFQEQKQETQQDFSSAHRDEEDLEALAQMADAAAASEGGQEAAPRKDDVRDFADIALEALRRSNSEVIPKAPIASDEQSMLGTSYDDFVPESKGTTETAAPEQPFIPMGSQDGNAFVFGQDTGQHSSSMPRFVSALDAPSFDPEAQQPDMPMPDFAKAMESPSYGYEPDAGGSQPDMPMPDFAKAMESPSYGYEPDTGRNQPDMPMPDFAKAAQEDSMGGDIGQPSVPVSDFSGINAHGAYSEGDISAVAENYSDAAVHAENYITPETYFGSADNIPYKGNVAADFSNGITGDNGQAGNASEAGGDLFPADFSGVSSTPADEFAVTGDSAEFSSDTPFTFIDANDTN